MPNLNLSANYTRSTFTLDDLVDRVQGDLALRNSNIITSGDITRWANEAQRTLARDTRAFHLLIASGVTSGTSEYPIPEDVAGRTICIEEVSFDGDPLPCVPIDFLYAENRNWRTATPGTPIYYYQNGFSVLGLYPAPDADDTDALSLVVTVIPPDVTEPDDQYYVIHGLEDAIVCFCCYRASLKDAYGEGKERIAVYRAEWQEWQRRAMEVAASINENEIVRIGQKAAYGETLNPFYTNWNTVASHTSS